jgi:lipoate---protein ligase
MSAVTEQFCGLPIGAYDFDDDLIEAARRTRMVQIRTYRPQSTCIVLGKGSKPDLELNLDVIRKDGISVLRRKGGGCSVVLDPGNLIISQVLPVEDIQDNRRYFNSITQQIIVQLEKAGLAGAHQAGISDLAIGDRKIGGAAIYRTNKILYYSTTLLLDADLDLLDRYLKHPPREPDYRAGRRHSDFVMNVGREWKCRLLPYPDERSDEQFRRETSEKPHPAQRSDQTGRP